MGYKQATRSGAIAPMTVLLLVPLMILIACAVDIGYIAATRTQLQAAADSAAFAAASKLITNHTELFQQKSREAAQHFARANRAGNAQVTIDPTRDVDFGFWDRTSRVFEAPRMGDPTVKINAVRVRAHRLRSNRQAVPLYFAQIMGVKDWNVWVESIAYIPNPVLSKKSSGIGTRFLIDEDMIDEDQPAIEALAKKLKKQPGWLTRAKDEKSIYAWDWFLNLPAGTRLELPTGQVGDEGLLDLAANVGKPDLPQYPFQNIQDHARFLMFNETSDNDIVSKYRRNLFTESQLDPLAGIGRFNQPSLYPELVNLDFIHVSPVYKGDISALDGVTKADEDAGPDLNEDGKVDGYTTNEPVRKGVNAKGYRRGLIAFKIVAYRIPKGQAYPNLPLLTIEVVDPKSIVLDSVQPVTMAYLDEYGAGGVQNVRMAK